MSCHLHRCSGMVHAAKQLMTNPDVHQMSIIDNPLKVYITLRPEQMSQQGPGALSS